jgi:hypothetical protein
MDVLQNARSRLSDRAIAIEPRYNDDCASQDAQLKKVVN